MATLDAKLTELATQALAAHGLVLVEARLTGGSNKRGKLTLVVSAEMPDGTSPTIDACTDASRTLSAQLDVADLITAAYTLEVGTPGLERPLNTLADYQRFTGKQAKLVFTKAKKFGNVALGSVLGTITHAEGTTVTLQPVDLPEPLTVDMDDIHHANLSPSAAELKDLMKAANARTAALTAEND